MSPFFIDLFESISLPVIGPSSDGLYFNLFYLLAFLTLTIWMIFEGKKQKLPWISWLLILAATRLAFIIGTKIITYNISDWSYFFETIQLPPAHGKVIIGGFILGLAIFLLLIKIFRFPLTSLDTLAFAFPISIAIQRMGCLIAGCCFGTPTLLPWGVSYSQGTWPHYHHFVEGWISSGNSLPVHPFPIYEALNGVFVAFLVWSFRKKINAEGGLFLLSLGLWAFFRTGIEFFRDPAAHAMGGELLGGMKIMQWLILTFAVVAFVIFAYREVHFSKTSQKPESIRPSQFVLCTFLFITVVATWSLRNWLGETELLAMNLLLFPCIGLSAVYLFHRNTVPALRWTMLALLTLPVFLMSQTWEKNTKSDSTEKKSYDYIKLGYGGGDFFSEGKYLISGPANDCGSNYLYKTFEYDYWNTGVGVGRVTEKEKGWLSYGANGSFGKFNETMVDTSIVNSFNSFSIQPHILWESKWYAAGMGLHLGNFYWGDINQTKSQDSPSFTSIVVKGNVYPSFYGRIGREKILFVDYSFSNAFPSPFPGLRSQFGVGSGFGLPKGNYLKFGVNNVGEFFQAVITPNERFQFTSLYSWRASHYYSGSNTGVKNSQFLVSLQYNVNHKIQK